MANTPTVYVLCDNNCKYEGLTKEQILAAITQAVNEGTIGNIDTGFVTTIKTINGSPLKFFVGTQDEYEALTEEQIEGLFAIIENDQTAANMAKKLEELELELTRYKEAISLDFANQPKCSSQEFPKGCITLVRCSNVPRMGSTLDVIYLPYTLTGAYPYAFKDRTEAQEVHDREGSGAMLGQIGGTWYCCGAFPCNDNTNNYFGIYQRTK